MDYEQHYRLQELLNQSEDNLIPAPRLFTYDEQSLYAAEMDRLSLDLSDGSPSPFRSKAPGSAHSLLTSAMVHAISILGHEVNLIPDRAWIHILRLLGTEIGAAESPVVNVRFTRNSDNTFLEEDIPIPISSTIMGRNSSIKAYTQFSYTIPAGQREALIPARVDFIGSMTNYRVGSLVTLEYPIVGIEKVEDVEILSIGRDPGSLEQIVSQTRNGIRSGSLGRLIDSAFTDKDGELFLSRCVTIQDYIYCAKRLGALAANAIHGVKYGAAGYFGDLTTLVVYPSSSVSVIDESIRKMIPAGSRLSTIPADIITVDGVIYIRKDPSMLDSSARDAIATVIVDSFNPPYGKWQHRNFSSDLAIAIEKIEGIYAVPNIALKQSIDGAPLSTIELQPWHLIEVQDSLIIESI